MARAKVARSPANTPSTICETESVAARLACNRRICSSFIRSALLQLRRADQRAQNIACGFWNPCAGAKNARNTGLVQEVVILVGDHAADRNHDVVASHGFQAINKLR